VAPREGASPGRPCKTALVGPTGVGKTTTIAKLASAAALRENRQVALLTLDTYRVAAADQLKTYARLLGVPLEIVSDPARLERLSSASPGLTKYTSTHLAAVRATRGSCRD